MVMVIPASSEEDIKQCLKIRRTVFIEEKKVPESIEVDENDRPGSACMHFLIYSDATPAGAFRVMIGDDDIAKLQRFCVLKEFRNKGLGSYAMDFIEGLCEAQGAKAIVFDAKCSAAPFYEKCGYTVCSEEFIEADVMHVKMTKSLK